MTKFIEAFIEIIESNFPILDGKIQHGALDAETHPPYAAYSMPEQKSIRTTHGIAGYRTLFDFIIIGENLSEIDDMKNKIVQLVDSELIGSHRCQLQSSRTEFFEQYNLDGILLTFKII